MGRIMWWFASAREEVDYRDTPASYITNVQEEEPPVLRHLGQEQLQLWETLPLVGKVLFWERFRHLSLELHHITIKDVLNAFLGYFHHDNVPLFAYRSSSVHEWIWVPVDNGRNRSTDQRFLFAQIYNSYFPAPSLSSFS